MDWKNPPRLLWQFLARYRAWVLWTLGTMFALRLLSLAASCYLDTSQTCADWFRYGLLGPLRFQWIFKYKELLAGLFAAAAAAIVIFPAMRQIREMARQSAIGAKTIVETTARSLENEREAINHILRMTFFLQSSLDRRESPGLPDWPEFEEPRERLKGLEPQLAIVRSARDRVSGPERLNSFRVAYLSEFDLFNHQVMVAEQMRATDKRMGGPENPPPNYDRLKEIWAAWGKFAERHNQLGAELTEAINSSWAKANSLGAVAAGD